MKLKLSLLFVLFSLLSFSQIEEKKIDELIQNTLKTFDVQEFLLELLKTEKRFMQKVSA